MTRNLVEGPQKKKKLQATYVVSDGKALVHCIFSEKEIVKVLIYNLQYLLTPFVITA